MNAPACCEDLGRTVNEASAAIHPSLSKNPGSDRKRPSYLRHQSSKALRGTTSTWPGPAVPLKPARKLKALWIIFWAKTTVGVEVPDDAEDFGAGFSIMRLDTDAADSRDTPMTRSDPAPAGPVELSPGGPLILNTELSFPGPMPPRNLKLGERPDDSADVASCSVVR